LRGKQLFLIFLIYLLLNSHYQTIQSITSEHNYLIYKDDFEDFEINDWFMNPSDQYDKGKWSIVMHEGNNVLSLEGNMDAHLKKDVDSLVQGVSEDFISVNNGKVNFPSIEDIRKNYSEYLENTEFSKYEDQMDPIIGFSEDGSIG